MNERASESQPHQAPYNKPPPTHPPTHPTHPNGRGGAGPIYIHINQNVITHTPTTPTTQTPPEGELAVASAQIESHELRCLLRRVAAESTFADVFQVGVGGCSDGGGNFFGVTGLGWDGKGGYWVWCVWVCGCSDDGGGRDSGLLPCFCGYRFVLVCACLPLCVSTYSFITLKKTRLSHTHTHTTHTHKQNTPTSKQQKFSHLTTMITHKNTPQPQ